MVQLALRDAGAGVTVRAVAAAVTFTTTGMATETPVPVKAMLGGDVYLVPVHLLNSRGAPLDARDFGEVPDELEVVRRRQSKRSRPARELADCLGFLVYEGVPDVVAGVGRKHQRDP